MPPSDEIASSPHIPQLGDQKPVASGCTKLRKPCLASLDRVRFNVECHRSIYDVVVVNLCEPRKISTVGRPDSHLAHCHPPMQLANNSEGHRALAKAQLSTLRKR